MRLCRTARMSPAQLRLACAAPRPALGFTSQWPRIRAGRLHVRARTGDGTPWLLIHGLAVSHRYLMPTAAALTDGPVHVPDLPGFGLSFKPLRGYDVRAHAAALAEWMTAADVRAARVLGNSFGCQVAVELAIRRPDLVAALILDGPTADPSAATMLGQARRWLVDLTGEDPAQARILAADIRDAGPWRIVRTLRHSVRHRIEDRLPLVTVPTLLLRGAFDTIAPPAWVERARRLLPDGLSAEVPGAAHNAVTTAGEAVAVQAMAFTASLSARPCRSAYLPATPPSPGATTP